MFKKPSASAAAIPVVNLETLGSDKTVKKAQFNFVPLFSVVRDGVGINIDSVIEHIIPWFRYQFRKKDTENVGKVKTVNVYWIDSMLRAGEDGATLNDPGVTLGLNLPGKQRKNIMGFGVPSLGFPDKISHREIVRVPVIWDVVANNDTEGNVDQTSGTLVLLELKKNQLDGLVAEMKKVTKPGVNYSYVSAGQEKQEKYAYKGIGYAYNLNKDSGRGFDTYQWSKTDMTVSASHWQNHLDAATKAFESAYDSAMKAGYFYGDIIKQCENGEIEFAEAEKIVVAMIAQKLLEAWGESFGDAVDDILTVFNEVASAFSYAQGAGISKMATGMQSLNLSADDEEDNGEPF